jgi:ABC-type multidrug transport system fused ATPase/permease subunit
MKNIIRIFRFILPYKGLAFLSIVFMLLNALFSVFSLAMIAPFLSLLFGKTELINDTVPFAFTASSLLHNFNYLISYIIINEGKVAALIFVCILVIVFTLFKNVFLYFSKFYMVPLRTGVVMDLRNQMYSKILELPLGYFSEERKGDLMSRMSQDIQEIEASVVRSLEMLFKDPIMIIAFMVALFIMSAKLTLFVLVLLPISGLIIGRIGKTLKSTSLAGQRKLGLIMSIVEETLSGLRIIKAFNAEKKMQGRFENTNRLYSNLVMRVFWRQQMASPVSEFLGVTVLVFVLWYGGTMVIEGSDAMKPEALITYLAIFSQIINPAKNVTSAYYNVLKGLASAERIDQILKADIKIYEKPDAMAFGEFRQGVEYRNVSFRYDKDLVLRDINLTIEKGKTIALVGRSGSGKSTLVDLLPRFIDVMEGEVLVDGINVKDFRLKDLRGLMGIVNQQSILFNDTFFNNIAFGLDDAREEDVIAAAKVANAHDFIVENPMGYYTNIGEGGSKLSGGQRQRVSIARAVLKNPPILILDEATSSLDTESERLVQDAMIRLMENRTSIVIAHRLSTVKHADLIVVIDEGRIVEVGKHDELLNIKGGTYRKLHKLQMY